MLRVCVSITTSASLSCLSIYFLPSLSSVSASYFLSALPHLYRSFCRDKNAKTASKTREHIFTTAGLDTQQSLSLVVFLPMTCQLMEMKASAKFQGPNRTATENRTCLHRPGSSLASVPTKSLSMANWQNGCGRTPAQPWQHTTHKATHCQSNFMAQTQKSCLIS